jgi:hypothetical protein
LLVEEFLAEAVDRDAVEFFVEGGEESDYLIFILLAQEMERPGRVLAAAPA